MRWIVDARSAVPGQYGGVSCVSAALCDALLRVSSPDQIFFATTGQRRPNLKIPRDRQIHLSIPNKIWSVASSLGVASLTESVERRVGTCDAAFFPNLGFFGHVTIPYTLLLHDLSFLIEPRWFSKKMRLWHRAVQAEKRIRGAAHLFAVSETTKSDTIRLLGIPPERITVIPMAHSQSPSLNTFHQADPLQLPLTLKERDHFILSLGAGDARKNIPLAIEAVRSLRKETVFQNLSLVLVGSPRSDNEPWITNVRNISDDELASLYQNAAVFLYPSWYEGFGLPLHEAAAHGTPCIASTAGALPETAPKGTFFADPAKIQHWILLLKKLLREPGAQEVAQNPLSPGHEAPREVRTKRDSERLQLLEEPWHSSARIIKDKLRKISLPMG